MKTNPALRPYLFLAILCLTGCKNSVVTTTPIKSNITESVYAAGIVKSENQYEVFSQINGLVETIFVKEGDFVKKGDPLFRLENAGTRLSTDNAELAALANDYLQNNEKIVDAQNAVMLAKVKLTNDSLLLARQQELWDQKIGSRVEVEQKILSFENSKVQLKRAEVAFKDVMRQLKLASDQSKNNLKIAQSAEGNLVIRSEVEGYVYKINVKPGELATSQKAVAIVGQKNFVIEFHVDEFDITKIEKGQKVMIRMDSYKNQIFEAQISFIYPMMEEQTRSFRVEAVFTKTPKVLYPNLTLEANIIIHEKKNVLTLPVSYLIDGSSVMLEDGSIRKVVTGLKDYTTAEILHGIDENTKIRMPKK